MADALVSGRFDKNDFNLKHTLISGEDGGLYLLLNSISSEKDFKEE